MSNPMPIYSQVAPKSQYKKNKRERPTNLAREFDPLNFNNGGNFASIQHGAATNLNVEKDKDKSESKRDSRRTKESSRKVQKNEASEGKVEAYLRQNQVSMRQQQHRHSAVRQAEHRVNLRSLPLNDIAMTRNHDRTPTERHRGFPEREREREHRRERDRERDCFEDDFTPLSPLLPKAHDSTRPVRKSTSSHRVTETTISTDKRRFFCREWAFQKIAHCLEQRPASKTCGALIIGDAGSGKTALCQELSEPGQGPQARQQRALNRRLLARHFLQSRTENSLRPGEFIRSLAMQILSHSSKRCQNEKDSHNEREGSQNDSRQHNRRGSEEDKLINRFKHLGEENEECSKPLLTDSEDQRTNDDELALNRRTRTIDRIHERDAYIPSMAANAPEVHPRTCVKPTNPFITEEEKDNPDARLYENHENLFLRNISQRQSKELRNSRLVRQSSEPLTDKKPSFIQKSLSENDERKDKIENSPPKSRIPVANFHYPNKPDIKLSSAENSPKKLNFDQHSSQKDLVVEMEIDKSFEEETQNNNSAVDSEVQNNNSEVIEVNNDDNVEVQESLEVSEVTELPEYTNVLKPNEKIEFPLLEVLLEKKRSQHDEVPPPIPSLPISPRTLIANAYYEKLLSDTEIQQALLPQNLEANPDECFKKALLFPLLEIDPPKQCLFLLVDGIDEGCTTIQPENETSSVSVAALLSRHQHLFPQWLLLVCTARKQAKSLTNMFTGFRKITLDELARPHVSADVQRYVLARLDTEPRLRARVSSDSTAAAAAAAALDHLRIKSDGCLLYLEKVLDGVADGFIALREIKEIPGTLNGLYLWLAQRLFHTRRFHKVRLLLDVLLTARCGVTEEMLYKCLLTKEYSVSREDFNRRLHLLRRVLVMERNTGYLSLFHNSFASWLTDVKHCTRRYLCSLTDGHAALAMCYTLDGKRLNAIEVHNFVYHMTTLEQHLIAHKKKTSEQDPVDLHTLILLWVLDSGCDIDAALRKTQIGNHQLTGDKAEECNETLGNEDKESANDPLTHIMPELVGGDVMWSDKTTSTLLQLKGVQDNNLLPPDPVETEDATEASTEEIEDTIMLDPTTVHEVSSKGDEETLMALLKRYPHLVTATDATGGTALHSAARGGKASCAAILLSAGARANAADGDGWSPLRAAAWAGHTEVVEVLLEHGCDVDCVDADNRTALRAAAWSGHSAVVTRLLQAGANPLCADAEGRTPLIAAAYMGHCDIVRALLDAKAEVDHADEDGRTALSVASLCGAGAACAALLVERGADVNKADRDGASPLLVAAFEGHTEICELLLEAEADIEAADVAGRTALWAAASAGHGGVVRLLLFWGACVDNMDHEGRTVLSTAAAQGNVEVVRQLLDRGLDEHHRDNSGWTPLHYAAFEGHIEVCEALLEAGAKVDEADNDGKGALMLAAQEGHTKLVEVLIDHWGAPVDQRAHDGKTALRLAALEDHFETAQALYNRGADVDALDCDRRSTLYALALDNRLAMARYLITECGANVGTTDNEGRTALHVSAWQGHTDMVNLLIKVGGAEVDGRDRCARTALHAAAWRGRAAVLRTLLKHGACVSAVCTQGATPLGIAAQEGHEECVMWLLQHGADPLQADHCGRTPAAVAWRAGHGYICRLLERCAPSAPLIPELTGSPELKRRSMHSNSTKSSSNLTVGSAKSHDQPEQPDLTQAHDKTTKANLSLSFAQQVARVGRGRRERVKETTIPENTVLDKDPNLRSYIANERDADIRSERDRRPGYSAYERDNMSPLYASPPHSPVTELLSPDQHGGILPGIPSKPMADQHFNRDTHMRIILGRESKPQDKHDSATPSRGRQAYNSFMGTIGRARGRIFKRTKNKRNGIVTNPAMRLVANVRNGLDNAAANIRRTGVALAASASSHNPAVKTTAFQWRKETPL